MKALYVALLVLFYASIPLSLNANFGKLAMSAADRLGGNERAYWVFFARSIYALCLLTCVSSVVVVLKKVEPPFHLAKVTMVVSALWFCVLCAVWALPGPGPFSAF